MTFTEMGQEAFRQAVMLATISSGNQAAVQLFPQDLVIDAEQYAKDCFQYMQTQSSYNPYLNARPMAERAAVEWAKAQLMGQDPIVSFAQHYIAWTETAAKQMVV